jgi:hypothetical protein
MRTRRWYTVFALLGLVLSTGCCCPCGERRFFLRRCCHCGNSGCSACSHGPSDCGGPIAPGPYIAPTPLPAPLPKAVPTASLNP